MATSDTSYSEQLFKLENPKKSFDKEYYLKTNPDVARDRYYGARPEEHYEKYGRNEGRRPNQEQTDFLDGVTADKILELKTKIKQEETQDASAKQIAALAEPGFQNNSQADNTVQLRDFIRSTESREIEPRGLIRSAELQEINEAAAAATENRRSIVPSSEQLPKEVGKYSFGIEGRKLNPDYDPEITKKWQEKERTYLYESLSKYTGKDKADKLKTKYDQFYSVSNLQADPNISSKLNSQVSDDQILDDYNISKLSRYNKVVNQGNIQTIGIQERLAAAQKLIDTLPSDSAQRTASNAYVDGLKKDLASVRSAVSEATSQIRIFKPLVAGSTDAAKEITSFRSFLQLPEERASQQLRQIDPESYNTSVELGKRYRSLATEDIGPTQNAQTEAFRAELERGYRDYSTSPIGATTTPETEALRQRIEGEAIAQLSLGAQLGAEEQRAYQQASRGAQSARGNIFGIGPAVEEAVTTGAAGEQRKLARYGAASQFLSSGQTTGDALARDVQLRNALQQSKLGTGGQFLSSGQTMSDAMRGDLAFRDALRQNRLGAASNFIAGGPSLYNLAQARTGQQQGAMQQYIQANQALPGGFGQQPSTAANFYQTTNPEIPVALTNAFNQLYRSQADYLGSTYGAQVGAISRQPSGAQNFGAIASGIGSFIPNISI